VGTASLRVVTRADGSAPHATTLTAARDWIVGRAHDSDIVIDDDRVSRRHLVLRRADGSWLVRDVSSNGSWYDGARIGGAGLTVPDGAELRLNLGNPVGPELILTSTGAAAPPAVLPDRQLLVPPAPPGRAPVVPPAAGVGSQARPRRHRGRIVTVFVVLLLIALVVADRVAARVAASQAVARVVQQSQGLLSRPSVSFGGFPFLTQVVFGKYTDIKVGLDGVAPSGSPRIEHISAHLEGAHIPLSRALHDDVQKIPVDRVRATVLMRFADLNAFLAGQPGHLVLSSSGAGLRVTGTVDALGQTMNITATGQVSVDGGGLLLTPSDVQVSGGDVGDALGNLGLGDLGSLVPPVPVPLPDLPFSLRLTSVKVHQDSLEASGSAAGVVLDAG
jgi:hypothetical protein